MLVHLSDTLEVRSYLNRANANNALTEAALESLDKFLDRLIHGTFRLRTEQEAAPHLDEIREALAGVSMCDPKSVEISMQSQSKLLRVGPVGQMMIYTVAEFGSIAHVFESTTAHKERREKLPIVKVEYQGEIRNIGLERRLRTLMNANGLKQVLRGSLYGVSFTKSFDKSIVSYFTHLFAHAMAGDMSAVERLLPLAKMFRSNMPVGRYPKEAGKGTDHWLIFVE